MPKNKEPDPLTKAFDRLKGEQATWVQTRKGVVATSPHMFGHMDRLSAALARVQLLDMPAAVMEAVENANEYAIEVGEERTPALIERWPAVHRELVAAGAYLESRPRWPRRRGNESGQ
jgi:hypothetical protein